MKNIKYEIIVGISFVILQLINFREVLFRKTKNKNNFTKSLIFVSNLFCWVGKTPILTRQTQEHYIEDFKILDTEHCDKKTFLLEC